MTTAVPHARRRACSSLVSLSIIATLAAPAALRAEPLDPKVELSLSLYDASFDSKVRLDSDALGLGDTSWWRTWRRPMNAVMPGRDSR